jgi:hypothetical protein
MLITVEQVEDICDNVGLEYSSFTNTTSRVLMNLS